MIAGIQTTWLRRLLVIVLAIPLVLICSFCATIAAFFDYTPNALRDIWRDFEETYCCIRMSWRGE